METNGGTGGFFQTVGKTAKTYPVPTVLSVLCLIIVIIVLCIMTRRQPVMAYNPFAGMYPGYPPYYPFLGYGAPQPHLGFAPSYPSVPMPYAYGMLQPTQAPMPMVPPPGPPLGPMVPSPVQLYAAPKPNVRLLPGDPTPTRADPSEIHTPPMKPVKLENYTTFRRGTTFNIHIHLRIPFRTIATADQAYALHQNASGYELQKHIEVGLQGGRLEQYLSFSATHLMVNDLKWKYVDTFNVNFDIYTILRDPTVTMDLEVPALQGLRAFLEFIGYVLDPSGPGEAGRRMAPIGGRLVYADLPRRQKIDEPPAPEAYNFDYAASLQRRQYEEPSMRLDRHGLTVENLDPTTRSRMGASSVQSVAYSTYNPNA
jgi:hypothetical protein